MLRVSRIRGSHYPRYPSAAEAHFSAIHPRHRLEFRGEGGRRATFALGRTSEASAGGAAEVSCGVSIGCPVPSRRGPKRRRCDTPTVSRASIEGFFRWKRGVSAPRIKISKSPGLSPGLLVQQSSRVAAASNPWDAVLNEAADDLHHRPFHAPDRRIHRPAARQRHHATHRHPHHPEITPQSSIQHRCPRRVTSPPPQSATST